MIIVYRWHGRSSLCSDHVPTAAGGAALFHPTNLVSRVGLRPTLQEKNFPRYYFSVIPRLLPTRGSRVDCRIVLADRIPSDYTC